MLRPRLPPHRTASARSVRTTACLQSADPLATAVLYCRCVSRDICTAACKVRKRTWESATAWCAAASISAGVIKKKYSTLMTERNVGIQHIHVYPHACVTEQALLTFTSIGAMFGRGSMFCFISLVFFRVCAYLQYYYLRQMK